MLVRFHEDVFTGTLGVYFFSDDHSSIARVSEVDEYGRVSLRDEHVADGVHVDPTFSFHARAGRDVIEGFKEFLGQQAVDAAVSQTVPKEIYEREAARVDKFISNLFDTPEPSVQRFPNDG